MSVEEAPAVAGRRRYGRGAERGPGYGYVSEDYQPLFVRVSELPAALAEGGRGAGYLPLVQFIKDWNRMPWCRGAMLDGPPPERTDPEVAAKIAAVVHALCDVDGEPVPDWVPAAVASRDVPLVPRLNLESEFGRRLRATAVAACRHHRVWFSAELLDST
ncbi:MAG: hypothetical protein OXG91_07940 [bacterium]|nr:hypothetical protein [bacterium]